MAGKVLARGRKIWDSFPMTPPLPWEPAPQNTKTNRVQRGFRLGTTWNLWVNMTKFYHEGCFLPFYLLQDERHERQAQRPLREAGKAICFKKICNGMSSRRLLGTEEEAEKGWNRRRRKTLSHGDTPLWRELPRDKDKNAHLVPGSQGGKRKRDERSGLEAVKSERGSLSFLPSGWINEGMKMRNCIWGG